MSCLKFFNAYLPVQQPSVNSGSTSNGSDSTSAGPSLPGAPQGSGSHAKSMSSMGGMTQQIFTDIGYHKGVMVSLKHIQKEHMQVSRNVMLEFNEVLSQQRCYTEYQK